MKEIITPATHEKAKYYSDFSGEEFEHGMIPASIKFSFGYGSKFDGCRDIAFDLSDEESKEVLNFIRKKLHSRKLVALQHELAKIKKNYADNVDARDWSQCDAYGNDFDLYKFLLND